MAPYRISIECDYREFWRYNLALSGEVRADGSRVGYIAYTDDVAAVGSQLSSAPAGYKRPRRTVVEGAAGDALTLYIYIVPNTLPKSRIVADSAPFEVVVSISHGDSVVYNRRLLINQWSGDNIEIKLGDVARG